MKLKLILFNLFSCLVMLNAQPDKFYFDHIDTKNGLSDNQVQCILKDSRGFLWIGTSMGLNRFDGYSFKILKRKSTDTVSLADDRVVSILEDHTGYLWIISPVTYSIYDPKKEIFVRDNSLFHKNIPLPSHFDHVIKDKIGDFWFVNYNDGLYWYSYKKDLITHLTASNTDTARINALNVSSITRDSKGNIWLISNNGVIEMIDPNSGKVAYRNRSINRIYNGLWMNLRLFIDSDDDIWIYSVSDAEGVYYLNCRTKRIQHFYQGSESYKLNNNIVKDIVQDKYGLLWVGTDHGGINIINKKDFTTRFIENNPDDKRSLVLNSVTALYRDNEDIIWVGTFKKGVCYYHENLYKFSLYRHQPGDPSSLVFDDINAFAEDEKGNIWIGTNGEGLTYFDLQTEKFHRIVHNPSNPASLSNNVIVSMLYDSKKRLWLGTFYGGLDLYDGKTFRHFRHNPSNPTSIADDRIWSIFEDSRHNIWVGTLGAGLDLFNDETNSFKHFQSNDSNSIRSNYIFSLAEDNEGNLWVGTSDGLDRLDAKTQKFTHYQNNPHDKSSLSSNIVLAVVYDRRGMIWAGTREGLNMFDPKTKAFKIFKTEDGLLDNSIVSMVEDKQGNIWIGTSMGLSCLNITENSGTKAYKFTNFTEADGLQGKEFNQGAAYVTRRGELFFAGPNGFNRFLPEKLDFNKSVPKVYITGFQILNDAIIPGKKINGRVITQENITNCKSIQLKHYEDVITIEFAALNYLHPEENMYKYKLEGFNREWMVTNGKERKATYTNLDPGEYVFKVVASNNDGVWNTEGASLKIKVLPPFWKSRIAFLVYLIFLIGSMLLARKIILIRERMKFSYEQDKLESQRRHELDLMKIRFFTNVSHEFRTPLTLILSPLEKMIKESMDAKQKPHLELIYRNARRLLNLVNQLLDFRRMEVQKIGLKPSYGDIVAFADEIYSSFSDLGEKKMMNYTFYSSRKEFYTFFDHDKLEKIVFNLLSNAFKFTGERGNIALALDFQDAPLDSGNSEYIIIKVTDTGIGMDKGSIDKIFERFFQNDLPGSLVNHGSGIGLSLTKEFVTLHNGTIEVESEPGKGSCFTVKIPVISQTTDIKEVDEVQVQPVLQNSENAENKDVDSDSEQNKPLLLLVEDNDDFRFYLKDNLKVKYSIIESSNGAEGLKAAHEHLPDLIVSDIMMPEVDGLELCKSLKADVKTSHIPIILLTARAAEHQKLAGFETGADDFISKPFSFEILESRIQNLISQRQRIKRTFQKHFKIEPGEIGITSLDEKLINKALSLVENNMGNPEYSVERLSKDLGMSRVHLYKKLLALTGKTPIEFIRTMRLKRAAQLLLKSQLNVSEIAYEVGFNDPRYFSKYFKTEFGVLPSQYNGDTNGENPNED